MDFSFLLSFDDTRYYLLRREREELEYDIEEECEGQQKGNMIEKEKEGKER
jgi:hypothetical protein